MWTILKVFIEFVTILLLFYVLYFWLRGVWDLSSLTRDPTCTPALEGKVLTTGPPGKSLRYIFYKYIFFNLWLVFPFFNGIFQETNIILMEFNLSNFSFIVCAFYTPSKKSLPNSKPQRYSPMFSSEEKI